MENTEEKTFKKLKQTPVNEMLEILQSIRRPPAVYALGGIAAQREAYYPDIQLHIERTLCLKQHGWEYEDFFLELERRSVRLQLEEHNRNLAIFPPELLARAKKFFPNLKFVPARIELE